MFGNIGREVGHRRRLHARPGTGEKEFYGEFLINAQGEDVVAGIRTPQPIAKLQETLPKAYNQLHKITKDLERHYQRHPGLRVHRRGEKLYMLQTRSGKRTGHGRRAHRRRDGEGEARSRRRRRSSASIPCSSTSCSTRSSTPSSGRSSAIAKGLNASPGAAAGKAAFTAEKAVEMAAKGERVVLVRAETSPDDIEGMAAAKGVLTATGGMTSHAAVVGRQMGKPSVVGCSALKVDEHGGKAVAGSTTISEGDYISIDGTTGEVFASDVPTRDSDILQILAGKMKPQESETFQYFDTFMKWADQVRTLKVRANADIPRDAKAAVALGAEGIGLCRTEHMFFAPDRLPVVQRMILAETEEARKAALELLPFQSNTWCCSSCCFVRRVLLRIRDDAVEARPPPIQLHCHERARARVRQPRGEHDQHGGRERQPREHVHSPARWAHSRASAGRPPHGQYEALCRAPRGAGARPRRSTCCPP